MKRRGAGRGVGGGGRVDARTIHLGARRAAQRDLTKLGRRCGPTVETRVAKGGAHIELRGRERVREGVEAVGELGILLLLPSEHAEDVVVQPVQ